MQSSKNKMSCFSGSQGGLDCFKVAHLANQNDIRVFAKSVNERFGKAGSVRADFSLSN